MLKTVLAFSFLLLLASCVSRHTPYPSLWSPPKIIDSVSKCPLIAGLYYEHGETQGKCPPGMEACSSLSYDLLAGHIGYKENLDSSSSPSIPIGDFIELRQPADNRLVIVQWQSGKADKQIISEHVLKMDEGDYSCDANRLLLKDRLLYFLWGISNIVGSISMSFMPGDDGSLILQSNSTYMGHHTFIPAAIEYDVWVRWLPTTDE